MSTKRLEPQPPELQPPRRIISDRLFTLCSNGFPEVILLLLQFRHQSEPTRSFRKVRVAFGVAGRRSRVRFY